MAVNVVYDGQTNIIKMIRGDSFAFNVNVEDSESDTGNYMLAEDDAMYIGVMFPHQKFEDALIKKKLVKADQEDDGTLLVTIDPEDTIDLHPGVYYYAVKLRQGDGKITTVINKTKFIIND